MQLYHYTTMMRLKSILQDGHIKLAKAFVAQGEKPAVWLTASPVWEQTANKMSRQSDGSLVSLDENQTAILGGGLVRIQVSSFQVKVSNWQEWKRKSGVEPAIAGSLAKLAVQAGSNLKDWRVSFKPIPRKHWEAIEVYNSTSKQWEPLEEIKEDSRLTE